MNLTPGQIRQYRDEGFSTAGPVFTPAECDGIVAEFERLRASLLLGDAKDGKLVYQPMLSLGSELLATRFSDPRLVNIAIALLGPDVRMYWEQAVAKPPQARTELPWHQDDGYAPTDPPGYLTAWIALENATLDNGCIWVIPKSHTRGIFRHHAAGPHFRSGIDAYDGDKTGVPVPVEKGHVLLFSSLMLHRSGPNTTGTNRRAWIVQYCTAAARHGGTGKPLDDRPWVARGGSRIDKPFSERLINVMEVYANWTPVS